MILSHLKNDLTPIDVTELPIVNDVRPVQPEKAELPIVVTELPMVTEHRADMRENGDVL